MQPGHDEDELAIRRALGISYIFYIYLKQLKLC